MTIILYSNSEEVNSFPKTLSNGSELMGNLRDECDIINPVISIVGMQPNDTFNYCYIPEFSRYYFITDKKIITTNVVEISLHEDVLQTWSEYILQQEGVVLRNEFEYDSMLIDDSVYIKPTYKKYILKRTTASSTEFNNFSIDGYNVILQTASVSNIPI